MIEASNMKWGVALWVSFWKLRRRWQIASGARKNKNGCCSVFITTGSQKNEHNILFLRAVSLDCRKTALNVFTYYSLYRFCRQLYRLNSARIGKISNRPSSISAESTNLERLLSILKFAVGPTVSSPGPILLKQAMTAEMVVSSEYGSSETIAILTTIKIR